MLEQCLPFTLTLIVDFINANFLIPRSDGEMVTGGGKSEVGDAVVGRRVEGDIFGDVAGGVCLTGCRRRGADGTEET